MLIGHIPAGYLATKAILRGRRFEHPARRRLMLLALAASVAPDLDLLWFFLVDHRRHDHHAYLPHLPLAVLAGLGLAAAVLRLRSVSRAAWTAYAVVGINLMLHLVLDTMAGGIRWLWPWSTAEFALWPVEAKHRQWLLNFVLHWTFGVELSLAAVALVVLLRGRPRDRPTLAVGRGYR